MQFTVWGDSVYFSWQAKSQLESIWSLLYWPFKNIGLSHTEPVLSAVVAEPPIWSSFLAGFQCPEWIVLFKMKFQFYLNTKCFWIKHTHKLCMILFGVTQHMRVWKKRRVKSNKSTASAYWLNWSHVSWFTLEIQPGVSTAGGLNLAQTPTGINKKILPTEWKFITRPGD